MKRTLRISLSVAAAMSALSASAQVSLPYIKTHTEARYQADSAANGNNNIFFPVAALPAVAESRSFVNVGGFTGFGREGVAGMPDLEVAFDDADAYARGQLPGNDGVYARAGGWSPGHAPAIDNVNALASVELYRNYKVNGSGVIPIDLVTFFEGFLYTGTNSGFSSNVEAKVTINVSMDGTLYSGNLFSASATLNHLNGFTTSGSVAGGNSLAGFNSAWADTTATLTSGDGHDRLWELNYLEAFNNIATANAGETIGLKYSIEVQANNDEGPFEIFSTADFSHSFKFNLNTSASGASLSEVNLVVPEPGSLLGLGLGFLAISRRKK